MMMNARVPLDRQLYMYSFTDITTRTVLLVTLRVKKGPRPSFLRQPTAPRGPGWWPVGGNNR